MAFVHGFPRSLVKADSAPTIPENLSAVQAMQPYALILPDTYTVKKDRQKGYQASLYAVDFFYARNHKDGAFRVVRISGYPPRNTKDMDLDTIIADGDFGWHYNSTAASLNRPKFLRASPSVEFSLIIEFYHCLMYLHGEFKKFEKQGAGTQMTVPQDFDAWYTHGPLFSLY